MSSIGKLTFLEPDLKKFPGLKFGWDTLSNPKSSPIVLNGSNEVAVDYFLGRKIKFTDIYYIVEKTLNSYVPEKPENIDDIVEIDKVTRMKTLDIIKSM